MESAKVDGKAWQVLSWRRPFDGGCQLLDADGTVVVDAGLLGGLQFHLAAWVEPLSRNGFVAESDSPNGSGRVTVFAGLAARRIGTQQAPRGLFLDVHSSVHSDKYFSETKIEINYFRV